MADAEEDLWLLQLLAPDPSLESTDSFGDASGELCGEAAVLPGDLLDPTAPAASEFNDSYANLQPKDGSPGSSGASGAIASGAPSVASSQDCDASENDAGHSGNKSDRNKRACAKYRELRKRRAQELRERASELQSERAELLHRIRDLRSEIHMLRVGGQCDLSKENDLLRSEVKRHRAFVSRVLSAAANPPDEITPEETYRVLTYGIESGVSQLVGLAYTSMVDPSWQSGEPILADGQMLPVRYQYLPIGASPEEATRFNLRFDVPYFVRSADECHKLFWRAYTDPKHMNHCKRGNVREVPIPHGDYVQSKHRFTDRLKMFYYNEVNEQGKKLGSVFTASTRSTDLFPAALHASGSVAGPIRTRVIVETSTPPRTLAQTNITVPDSTEGFVEAFTMHGALFWELDEPGRCAASFIESFSLCDPIQADMTGRFVPSVDPETGELAPVYKEDIVNTYMGLFYPQGNSP